MKTTLIGINAKYIHTNLAIRLLIANTENPVDMIEFTIKDNNNTILNHIIDNNYEIVGISCYIWNIEKVKEIITEIKNLNKNIIIILGGPEVSYDPNLYINEYDVDYVIINEGEVAFNALLNKLNNNMDGDIPNLVSKDYIGKSCEIRNLKALKSPYYLPNDYASRITYIETSRGCPFNCSYCLASLEKHVRFFDIEQVKKDIIYLQEKGARTFKFLDRTFNTDVKAATEIFSFIIENHLPNTSWQFEITGDILHNDIIEYLNNNAPKNLFRFEIGIQSTNIQTNRLVDRIQDNQKLFNNILKIQNAGIIDLHLDLIAGLPQEDIISFANTFDEVIALRPLELQLGFLKMLKGTKLRREADKYGYVYNDLAPYEIISNDFLSVNDIKDIKLVEEVLEKFYNSQFMPKTIRYILDINTSAFNFFLAFGKFYEASFSWTNYNVHDLFIRLLSYLKSINYFNYDYVFFLMKYDYLSYFKIKPKIWWQRIPKSKRNKLIEELHNNSLSEYSLEDLYRNSIIEPFNDSYLIAIYKHNYHKVFIIEK